MSQYANLWLHRTFLEEVLKKRPDRSKVGYLQNFIWREFFQWKMFDSRNILMERGRGQNQLAGLSSPEGQALPRPKVSGDTFLSTLMDVKSYALVKPDIVQADLQLGELAVARATGTSVARQMESKVTDYITNEMAENEDVVDNMLEYLAVGALKNAVTWPPVTNAGAAITPAPRYWGSEIAGTWNVGLAAELNQVITSLVDNAGSAATADQRKVWSDASADIIGALDVVDQICRQNHAFTIRGGQIICRSTLMKHLIKNTAILNLLRGDTHEQPGASGFITTKQLEDWFATGLDYKFRFYDTFWTYEALTKNADYTPSVVYYLNENEIIFIPPQGISGWMGTAPLETEDGSYNEGGPMPWLYRRPKPPYEREMGVHTVAWPVFADNLMWVRLQVLT